jgi:hypothetical protein
MLNDFNAVWQKLGVLWSNDINVLEGQCQTFSLIDA